MKIILEHTPGGVYFTADTHFGHRAMVETWRVDPAGGRFSSTEAMDEHLIHRWNSTVPGTGVVYHLGDFAFANTKRVAAILAQLNGTIHLIEGNHDKSLPTWIKDNLFGSVQPYLELTVKRDQQDKGRKLVLCHYALRTWNRAHYNTWNLHGHSHGNLPYRGGQIDVGVDDHRISRDYRPYTFEEIDAHVATTTYEPNDHHENKGRDGTEKDKEQFG